jgi:hypothetical protein
MALLAQVMLKAQPRRRHLRDGGDAQPRQIGQPKSGAPADQKERIARGNLAKAQEGRAGVKVARLHHPHRPAPRYIDRPVEQTRSGRSRCRRIQQFHLDALAGVESERVRGIEWRVEDRAEIL